MNNFTEYFISLGSWAWMILGLVLLVIEVLAPGVFMLWFGLAAVVTGLISFVIPIGPQAQLGLFAVLSLVCVLIGRKLFTGNEKETDQPLLNKRGDQLVGKTFQVTTAIKHGRGKIRVGDTVWSVSGPDAQVDEHVRVTALDGNRLSVELVDDK